MASVATKNNSLLLAAAVAHGVLALGHTSKGAEMFKHPSLKTLPAVLRGAVRIGWYEGSGFFLIMGILNYKWSQTGIYDIYDKGIAGVLVALLSAASTTYYRTGDRPTAATLAIVAILQGLAVKHAN